jgi:hypothetical protein
MAKAEFRGWWARAATPSATEGAPALAEQTAKWIPVAERLPQRHIDILITLSTGKVVAGIFCGEFWDWAETDDEDDANAEATDWKPWPAPAMKEKLKS